MTAAHKAALAAGRDDSRTVKAYLEALDSASPRRRGRQRTTESIERRLVAIDKALPEASALIRLQLVQERSDLRKELLSRQGANAGEIKTLRSAFVKVAKAYGARKGIGYDAWREVGVDAATLKDAGIGRG
jgi:hypothetical protein